MPAVCLIDPRGRELLVACTPVGWDIRMLPDWVYASNDDTLLAWKVGGHIYFWDGLRVCVMSDKAPTDSDVR